MGFSLKDFFDDIIPNEIKQFAQTTAGKVILGAGAGYIGYKAAPIASKYLFGTAEKLNLPFDQKVSATKGLISSGGFKQTMGSVFGMEKYGYDKGILGRLGEEKGGFLGTATKFVKGMGEDKLGSMLGYDPDKTETMATKISNLKTKNKVGTGGSSVAMGNYTATKTNSAGFNNASTQSAMANIMKYYNDIANGRIPSESYTVEGTKGTTIGIPSGSTKIRGV